MNLKSNVVVKARSRFDPYTWKSFVINDNAINRILTTIDEGLQIGVGYREPGHMCVEAAVCYGLGLPHGDDPHCVNSVLRSVKLILNDSHMWQTPKNRANGLRRLAIAQFGTLGTSQPIFNEELFNAKVTNLAVNLMRPAAEMSRHVDCLITDLEDTRLEKISAVRSTYGFLRFVEWSSEHVELLSKYAEGLVQILIELEAPGCQWLHLTTA